MTSHADHHNERLQSSDPAIAAKQRYDIIIVGAGIVGCALAYGLGQSGRKVLLLERDLSVPDRIVGELLQPAGCVALTKLGMIDCLDDIDSRVCRGYQVYWGARSVPIPYPEWPDNTKVSFGEDGQSGSSNSIQPKFANQAEGRSFHHGYFVNALRKKAITCPNVTLVEGTANDLLNSDVHPGQFIGIKLTPSAKANYPASSSSAASPTSVHFKAPLTFIIDGYASKFRRMILPDTAPTPIVRSNFVALLLKDADLPSPGLGHVIMKDDSALSAETYANSGKTGPVLVYQLSEHDTRMLVDVPGAKLPSIGNGDLQNHLRTQVLPCLPSSIVPSFEAALKPEYLSTPEGRLRSMPNSVLPAYPQHSIPTGNGCLLVGDALNMRHPLTGGGMTVGLNDAVILTDLFGASNPKATIDFVRNKKEGQLSDDEQDWVNGQVKDAAEKWYWKRKAMSGTINVLAQALYSLLAASDDDLEALKMGCFKYFERGGRCVEDPVSFLSGLKPSQALLFYHFFAVAFYSIYLLFTTPRPGQKHAPSPLEYPALTYRGFSILWSACVVFLPTIWAEGFAIGS